MSQNPGQEIDPALFAIDQLTSANPKVRLAMGTLGCHEVDAVPSDMAQLLNSPTGIIGLTVAPEMLSTLAAMADRKIGLNTMGRVVLWLPGLVERTAEPALAEAAEAPPYYKFFDKNLIIDNAKHKLYVGRRRTKATPTQFSLLWFFAQNFGKPLTREEIKAEVWPDDPETSDETVNATIYALRHKVLGNTWGRCIQTIPGIGYVMNEIDSKPEEEEIGQYV